MGNMNRAGASIAFLLFACIVFLAVYFPLAAHIRQTPLNTTYLYAHGYMFDYYQYLSWIKSGALGDILLTTRYTQEQFPLVLVHPLYTIAGFLLRPFVLPTHIVYLGIHITAIAVFLISLWGLIRTLFVRTSERIIACILFAAETSTWRLTGSELIEPIAWSTNFNIIGKFNIPSHHLLALACIPCILRIIVKGKGTISRFLYACCLSIFVGFLNPSLLFPLYLCFGGIAMGILWEKQEIRRTLAWTAGIIVVSIPVFLYHIYLFHTILPWSLMYRLMLSFEPSVTFAQYILALGPLFLFALVGLCDPQTWKKPLVRSCIAWGIVPVFLFWFVPTSIPMNHSRLFQFYQYIPLTILAETGILLIGKKWKAASWIICFILLAYAVVPFTLTLKREIKSLKLNAYNVYIPNAAMHAFAFLDSEPLENVVLSGEYMSSIIPAVTKHRVILGRDDNAPDYYAKRDRAFSFVSGKMSENEARIFLNDYRISSILFGVDTQPFELLPYSSFPFFKEVFREGLVSIIKVIN